MIRTETPVFHWNQPKIIISFVGFSFYNTQPQLVCYRVEKQRLTSPDPIQEMPNVGFILSSAVVSSTTQSQVDLASFQLVRHPNT